MGTSNFHTMDNFPLIVIMNEDFSYPIENDDGEPTGELAFDEDYQREWIDEMEARLSKINLDLSFHEIILKSGYYDGLQFYVEEKYNDILAWVNEDFQSEFELNRSTALRKYDAEIKRINKLLRKLGKEHGMVVLECLGRFSNGEAVYRLETKKEANK